MKKIMVFFLIFTAFSFSGCGTIGVIAGSRTAQDVQAAQENFVQVLVAQQREAMGQLRKAQ